MIGKRHHPGVMSSRHDILAAARQSMQRLSAKGRKPIQWLGTVRQRDELVPKEQIWTRSFAWPLHSTELFVTHVPVTCSVTQLVIEEPVVELLRLPVRPSLSRSRRNTSSSVGIFELRPDRSP